VQRRRVVVGCFDNGGGFSNDMWWFLNEEVLMTRKLTNTVGRRTHTVGGRFLPASVGGLG